jgi:hypothetical protein
VNIIKTLGLVACGKNKSDIMCKGKDLYLGDLFKKSRKYVEREHDEWRRLSALHHIIHPENEVEPYDYTLNSASKEVKKVWSEEVFKQISSEFNTDIVIYLYAGSNYREFLQPLLEYCGFKVLVPMKGLGIGQQLGWLKNQLESD